MVIIKAQNLTKIYSNGKVALQQVTLEISSGEMVGILGLSGSGKTTFFRLLNGSISPTSGTLKLFDQTLKGLRHRQLRKLRQKMALVYQHHNIIPGLSVARNVFLGCLKNLSLLGILKGLIKIPDAQLSSIALILSRLEIRNKIYQRATDLSGGEQQRVALARAMISEPELLLADEPIASVDAKTARLIMDIFQQMNRETATTILMNLHQVDLAVDYCSRILVFRNGKIMYDGAPDQLPPDLYESNQIDPTKGGLGCD